MHSTLKQMGFISSRRPHQVPLLSAKNKKPSPHFTPAHRNCTTEDWKHVAWSADSLFLLQHSDSRIRIPDYTDAWIARTLYQWFRVVLMVRVNILLTHFGPLSTNLATFKSHRLLEFCC